MLHKLILFICNTSDIGDIDEVGDVSYTDSIGRVDEVEKLGNSSHPTLNSLGNQFEN